MCVWMREERNADSSTPHFKLGFLNLTKRANGYRADKRNAVDAADALHARKVRAPVVALTPYDGVEPSPAVSTLKEGEHECQYCHMQVNGKDLMLHMVFHIGRGEAVGVCRPCIYIYVLWAHRWHLPPANEQGAPC